MSSELEQSSTEQEREQEPGASRSDDQSNSCLTEPPPPSFQDSFAYPTKVPSHDELPPPYMGKKEDPSLPPYLFSDEATQPHVSLSPEHNSPPSALVCEINVNCQ